jgi:DNA-binding NtrC family response regulator
MNRLVKPLRVLPPPSSETSPMVGDSAPMKRLRQQLLRMAQAPGAVLVQGETGSGKELAARALHHHSPRAAREFIALNCAAIPRELIEAELFGSAPGAFTGARARPGLFRAAHRGTLFLDEIGDLSLPAQAALLRVIETGTLRPLGSDTVIAIDVRLVCATHRNLKTLAESGSFRADLYHRISTFTLTVPPLRTRIDDLPALARALAGQGTERLTAAAWRTLRAHPWPGNVRELRNVLLRTLATTDGPIHPHDLELGDGPPPRGPHEPLPPGRTLRERITTCVRQEVEAQGGNLRAAARVLGISPTTLYRYLVPAEGLAQATEP